MRRPKYFLTISLGRQGFTLIEVAIGIAFLGIVVLAIVKGLAYVSHSFTQSKIKQQALQYAQAEADHIVQLAKLPAVDPQGKMLTDRFEKGGVPIDNPELTLPFPEGYMDIASLAETLVTYPQDLLAAGEYKGVTPSSSNYNMEKKQYFRSVQVDTQNPSPTPGDVKNEYKTVRVTLRDSNDPPRFSPIMLNTVVRRPSRLDDYETRDITNLAYIQGTVKDKDSGKPVPNATVRVYPGAMTAATDDAGRFRMRHLSTAVLYTSTVTATGYWPKTFAYGKYLQAGVNEVPAEWLQLKQFRYMWLNVHLTDGESGIGIEKVRVTVKHKLSSPLPSPPAILEGNNPWLDLYVFYSDSSGLARYKIPIPGEEDTYNGYQIIQVWHPQYLPGPATSNSTYVDDIPLTYSVDPTYALEKEYKLTKKKFTNLRVVLNGVGTGTDKALVQVFDEECPTFEKYNAADPISDCGSETLAACQNTTSASGSSAETLIQDIPVNTIYDQKADSRPVFVRAQRVGGEAVISEVTIRKNVDNTLTIPMPKHTLLVQPAYVHSESGDHECAPNSTILVRAAGYYGGYSMDEPHNVMDERHSLPGATDLNPRFNWMALNGFVTLSARGAGDRDSFYVDCKNGVVGSTYPVRVTGTFSYKYQGGLYGPSGDQNVSSVADIPVRFIANVPADDGHWIDIYGPDSVPQGEEPISYTLASDLTMADIQTITWSWTGVGSWSKTGGSKSDTVYFIPGSIKGTAVLSVSVTYSKNGESGTLNTAKTILVGYGPLSVSLSCSGLSQGNKMETGSSCNCTAVVSNGNPGYYVLWSLSKSNTELGAYLALATEHDTPTSTNIVVAGQTAGDCTLKVQVTDSSNNKASADIPIKITTPGGGTGG